MTLLETWYDLYLVNRDQLETDADDAVSVDRDDVLQNLADQAALYARWARLAVIAESKASALKTEIKERIWVQSCMDARSVLDAGTQKVTKDTYESIAYLNQSYIQAVDRLAKLDETARYIREVANALFMRASMLQSLNSRQRAELASYGE